MRVLHLISSSGVYGAETMLLGLASAQGHLGCEPIVGVFHNKHMPHVEVVEEARKRGLKVEVLPCDGRFDRKVLQAIRHCIQVHGVALVHGHGYKPNLYGYFAAKSLGVPFIATCHLWTGATLSIRIYEYIDLLILRRAQGVVGVSDVIAQILRDSGVPHAKISTIYNGVDFSPFLDPPAMLRQELGVSNKLLIGTVCRLEEQKGIEYFIRAALEVLREFPSALFAVVGEGSLRSRLDALVDQLGLGSNILFLGYRSNMQEVYASLDLFVLASVDEGMPMTILEALAARRPVVATRVGAVEKLIIPEQTGLLVEARDVAALRDAMLKCLRDPSFARELGRKGAEHVRKSFSAEGMAKNYLDIYHKVLDENGRKAPALLQHV